MHIEAALPRYRLAYNGDGTRVAIPARRNWFIVLFLCAWMAGWVMGETTAIAQLLKGNDAGSGAFMYFWLAGWTVGGACALLTICWQLFGQELLTVSEGSIDYRIEILGLGRTRSYATALVTGLRATAFDTGMFSNQAAAKPPFFGAAAGPIAFDYGARTIRFAPALDEAEAKLLVEKLKQRLPASVFA